MSPHKVMSSVALGWFLLLAASAQGQAVWSQIPPPGISHPFVVADSARHRVVLFGGDANVQCWALSLDSAQWADLHATNPPTPSTFRAAIVDPFGDRILYASLFGTGAEIQQLPLGVPTPDWTTLATQGIPPAPLGGMVYDRGGRRVIAWEDACNTCVYQLSLTTTPPTWSPIAVSGSGSGLQIRTAIYDPVRNRIVGLDATALPWALPLGGGGVWSRIFPVGTPPPGGYGPYSVAYDPIGDRLLALEKNDRYSTSTTALWGLSLASPAWQMLADWQTSGVPQYGECVYDPVDQRLVTYGFSGTLAVDTYRLNGPPQWTRVSPATNVVPGYGIVEARTIVDPVRDRLLWFENYTFDNGGVPRLWELPLLTDSGWHLLAQSGPKPPGLVGSAIVYDPPRDRFLYFSGNDGTFTHAINDVWALDPTTTTWTHLAPTGTPPPPRARAAAAYDPIRDRLVIFGGAGVSTDLNDVWSLSLSGPPAWSVMTPSGTPPTPRRASTLAYDPRRDEMLLFGGSGNQDAWVLSLGASPAWTILSPIGSPGSDERAYFDPVRDRLVAAPKSFNLVSVLTGGTAWTEVATIGKTDWSPSDLTISSPDPAGDRWIVSGKFTLSFGGTALPSVGVPGPTVWTPGASQPLSYRIRNPYPYDQPFAWQLTSERNWPGLPLAGVVTVPANDSVSVPVSVGVPDTVAAGLNRLVFRATATSPLVTATGTHHLHDATTATDVALAGYDATPDRVTLRWWSSLPPGTEARADRRESESVWTPIATGTLAGDGSFEAVDSGVEPGRTYAYRLSLTRGSEVVRSEEAWVAVPAALAFALDGARPNPGEGLDVSFTLPAWGSASLEVLDVGGRRLLTREVGSAGPGRHLVRMARPGALPPGIYLVRLRREAVVLTRRAVILR